MTAAALLVVLCCIAHASERFDYGNGRLAGVLLSESTFRHQIKADIEPFRGILLGLFSLGLACHWIYQWLLKIGSLL